MKARHNTSGKEITILGISKDWGTATYIDDGVLYQTLLNSGEWTIIDDSQDVDWSAFRREAAKDILAAGNNSDKWCMYSYKDKVSIAINIADELIKQLKDND